MTRRRDGGLRRTSALTSLGVLSAGLLGACGIGAPDADDPAPTSVVSSSPAEVPAPSPPSSSAAFLLLGSDGLPLEVLDSLDTSQAVPARAGTNYSELFDVAPSSRESTLRNTLALSPARDLVMSEMPPARDGALISQATVGLFDGAQFEPFPPADVSELPTEPRQAVAADRDGSRVAWMETPSTDLFFSNWRVFLYDGVTTRLVGRSEQVLDDLMPIVHGEAYPTLGSDAVFWETPYPRGEQDAAGHYQDFGLEILGAPWDGGGVVEVARDGFSPAAHGAGVVFVRQFPWDKSMRESEYQIEYGGIDLRAQTLVSGTFLDDDQDVISLAASDDTIVWAVASRGGVGAATMYVYDIPGGRVQPIELHDVALSVSVSNDLVGWGNGSGNWDAGQYVFDLETHRLWTLGASAGLSNVLVSDASVAWSFVDADTGMGGMTVAAWLSR